MDIENLKLIISTLNDLGANTKESFIWWLVLTNGATYLFGFIWSCISLYVIKLGYKLINNSINNSNVLNSLMEAAGVSHYFTQSELKKACEKLKNNSNN